MSVDIRIATRATHPSLSFGGERLLCSAYKLVTAALIDLLCRLPRGKDTFHNAGSCQPQDDDSYGDADFPSN